MEHDRRCLSGSLAGVIMLVSLVVGASACSPMPTPSAPSAEQVADANDLKARKLALTTELQRVALDMPDARATVDGLRRQVEAASDELNRNLNADTIQRAKQTLERTEAALAMVVPKDRVTADTCSKDEDFALAYQSTCKRLLDKQKADAADPPHQCIRNDLADCSEECERGHAGSCENLANMYQTGEGVQEDQQKATRFFITACLNGQVSACGDAGNAVVEGIGITASGPKGETLLVKSCDAKDPFGCFQLARYQERRGGVERLEQAARLYQFACDNDLLDGCVNLGVMYAYGKGISQDKKKAAEYFKLACDKGEQVGCNNLAILQGKKPPASPAQIEQLWQGLVTVADDLASKRFIARYATQQARGARGQRQVQLMQQHMAEFQREEYCPARKAFVDAAGQAEFRKRTQAKCKDDPPVAGGLNGPENLTADCRAVFAGGCP